MFYISINIPLSLDSSISSMSLNTGFVGYANCNIIELYFHAAYAIILIVKPSHCGSVLEIIFQSNMTEMSCCKTISRYRIETTNYLPYELIKTSFDRGMTTFLCTFVTCLDETIDDANM